MKFYIGLIIMVIIIVWLVAYQTHKHEEVHKKIYEKYGCQNVSVKYETVFNGKTKCLDLEKYDREGDKIHLINEIVGYNTLCIILTILSSALLIFYRVSNLETD